ncbi:ROK family transcriptional regulator [Clostridium sp. C105KSO13]|uniref:ROK family transcriptional regulator n=1 Tax=Clostridium sp. C105KSO13 TaxID=1776045 RepID=UPI0007405D3A|nr:ROK family transcriptional regulator [Clostridium sp. C105KSO13]CUX26718.1 N-acetylglucosamine repressor [Clostridium sp. C105KSO13]
MIRQKTSANLEIKKMNRSNIYHLLRNHKNLSRQDIARELRLSLPTVIQNLEELQDEGLVRESGSIGHTGGRRAKSYAIVPDARIAIGIDITRNHITVLAVNLEGTIVYRTRTRVPFQRTDKYYKEIGKMVEQTVSKVKKRTKAILGVGISVPGLITKDNQEVFYGKILNFTGATCSEFSKYIPYRTALFNDANAAGVTETWLGGIEENAFYLMLSNNVGGAVVVNGSVYTGETLHGGEVGHIKIHPGGKDCYCGQRGCVDAYCSATVLSNMSEGNLEDFFQKLNMKNPQAIQIWEEYLESLALTINQLQTLFDCTIILGGYMGEYLDPYIEDIRNRVQALSSFDYDKRYIRVSKYKKDAIAAGAALDYITEFVDAV